MQQPVIDRQRGFTHLPAAFHKVFKHGQITIKIHQRGFSFNALQLIYPAHNFAVHHRLAIGQLPDGVTKLRIFIGNVLHKLSQGNAARSIQGGNTGYQAVDQSIQLSRQQGQSGEKPSLTVAVQGQRPAMESINFLAKSPSATDIVLTGHILYGRGGGNILDHPDIGRHPLVGIGMGITFLLTGKKTENVLTQHIRGDQKHWFAVVPDGYSFVRRQYLVEEKMLRLRHFFITRPFKMKAIFSLNATNCLGIITDNGLEQGRLLAGIIKQGFRVAIFVDAGQNGIQSPAQGTHMEFRHTDQRALKRFPG